MATLYERLESLCQKKGIKGGRMCTDLNISKSLMTDLKSGRKKSISAETAQKIASYFDVSVGYLLGEEPKTEFYLHDKKGVRSKEILFALSNGGKREITDEMFDEVIKFAEYIASRQKRSGIDKGEGVE